MNRGNTNLMPTNEPEWLTECFEVCCFVLWVTPVDIDKRLQESDTRD